MTNATTTTAFASRAHCSGHQEAVNQRGHGNAQQSSRIDEQPVYPVLPAMSDCARNQVYRLDKGAFAGGVNLADTSLDLRVQCQPT